MQAFLSFLFFLTFTLPLFSETTFPDFEAKKSLKGGSLTLTHFDPTTSISQKSENLPKVNITTGEYIEEEVDFAVAGSEPLSLRRFYNHFSPADNRYGSWRINPETHLVANFELGGYGLKLFASVGFSDGSISYIDDNREGCKYCLNPQKEGQCNFSYTISGQTNPINTSLSYYKIKDPKNSERWQWKGSVTDGTGNVKEFESVMHGWHKTNIKYPFDSDKWKGNFALSPANWTPYVLNVTQERRPNGNIIEYSYIKWRPDNFFPQPNLLSSITTYNSTKTKKLGHLQFHYATYSWQSKNPIEDLTYNENVHEVSSYSIEGSDGRKASYQQGSPTNNNPTLLSDLCTPDHTLQMSYSNNKLCHVKGAGRSFSTEYDPNTHKVTAQKAPVGPNGEMEPIARYIYHDNHTEMFDAENNKTLYFFDKEKRITKIDRFQGNSLFQTEENSWDTKGWLTSKTLKDAEGSLVQKVDYSYDKRGNVLEETQSNSEESHTLYRTYSDDGFNLTLSESDGFGKTTRYSYLSNTNLLASEHIYEGDLLKKRTFYTYDDCAICIKKITDDGPSENADDLTGVTYRKIIVTTPKQDHPCFGLPQIVEEKTIDGQGDEILVHKIHFTYHPSGKIQTQSHYDANNQHCYTLTNGYDERERLIARTDALGQTTTYEYDVNNNLTATNGPRPDMRKTWTYDLANRPTKEEERQTDGTTLTTQKQYDKLGRVIATIDACGAATQYCYYVSGRVTCISYPDGAQETKTYDVLGNVIEEQNPNGEKIQCSYNLRGKPLRVTNPDGTEELFTYNPDGNLHTHTDRNGATTDYIYDVFDNPIKTEVYSSQGSLLKTSSASFTPFCKLSETDGEGLTTTYSYDFAGRKIAETLLERTISFGYDALGNLTTTQKGDILYIDNFDFLGHVIETRTQDLSENLYHKENYQYDATGNCTHVITSKGITETTYDSRGQILQTKDPLGHTTRYSYGYEGKFSQTITNPKGIKTTILHDQRGREVTKIVNNCHGQTIQKECKTYDLASNQILAEEHIYKGSNLSHTITNRWEYGPSGRVEKAVESDEKQTTYTYDNRGRLQTITKPSGVKIHHTYDDLGRLTRFYSSYEDVDYTYSYDHNDNLLSIYDLASDKITTRTYDSYSNLIQESLANGITLINDYDTFGRRTELTLPDETSIHYSYKADYLYRVRRKDHDYTYEERDLEGNVTKVTLPQQTGTILFERDALSRISKYSSPHFQAHFQRDSYDQIGNLYHYSYQDSLGTYNASYSYDDLNQLILENGHHYAYDSLGNRLQKDDTECTVNNLCQITSDGERDYSYDANGNLLTDGESHYTYDSLDRLICVTKGATVLTFTYDSFHRRLTKQTADKELEKLSLNLPPFRHHYIWDGENEIGVAHNNQSIAELRVLGAGHGAEIGSAVFLELEEKSYIPIHDHRGNLVTLIDLETAEAAETYRYSAFGEELTDHKLSPWRFSSKRVDDETALIYFGRRYYHPNLGRWITADPQGFEDGPNLYAYLHNCPLIYCDQYGLWSNPFAGCGGVRGFFGQLSRSAFSGIEAIGKHLIPFPVIRDVVEAVGRWGRGGDFFAKSAHRINCNNVYTISDEKIDGHSMPYKNGLGVTVEQAKADAQDFSDSHGGVQVDLLYNGTRGFITDLIECGIAKLGLTVGEERMTTNYFENKFAADPDHKFDCYVHSQGGSHFMNATRPLKHDQRQQMNVYSFGSATLIPDKYFGHVENYVSKLDIVPMTSTFRYAQAALSNNSNVHFLSPTTKSPLKEHYLKGDTYWGEIKRLGKIYKEKHDL